MMIYRWHMFLQSWKHYQISITHWIISAKCITNGSSGSANTNAIITIMNTPHCDDVSQKIPFPRSVFNLMFFIEFWRFSLLKDRRTDPYRNRRLRARTLYPRRGACAYSFCASYRKIMGDGRAWLKLGFSRYCSEYKGYCMLEWTCATSLD